MSSHEAPHLDGLRFEVTRDDEHAYEVTAVLRVAGDSVPLSHPAVFYENTREQFAEQDASRLSYVLEAVSRYYDIGGDLYTLLEVLEELAPQVPRLDFRGPHTRLVDFSGLEDFEYVVQTGPDQFLRVLRDSTFEYLTTQELFAAADSTEPGVDPDSEFQDETDPAEGSEL